MRNSMLDFPCTKCLLKETTLEEKAGGGMKMTADMNVET